MKEQSKSIASPRVQFTVKPQGDIEHKYYTADLSYTCINQSLAKEYSWGKSMETLMASVPLKRMTGLGYQ